ncbi:MAG: hypothetical protein R3B70_02950 [Polyangiaceae bacterium]
MTEGAREAASLPPWMRSRAPGIGLAIAAAAVLGVGFVPLFDGPGYEIALAAGLLLPVVAAVSTALETSRYEIGRAQPIDLLFRGVANGAVFGAAAYLTTLIHGARAGFCDVWTGTWIFALGPWVGAVLGGAWGAVAGELAAPRSTVRRRRVVAVLAGIAGPLASVGVSLGRFFGSPMVFAYDPFAGFFSGTLYDTVINATGLVTYRAGTAATLGAAIVLALHLRRADDGRGLAFAWRGRGGVALAGALCAAASVAHIAYGPEMGHYQTPASIAEALGGRSEGARCTVLHARGMRPDDVKRFVKDCDAHVRKVEAWFEGKGPEHITVYLFADVRQKAALMGAAETQVAKPWRREVYVQEMAYPHPVIGHELAHVIAGSFARGPFKTGGDVLGLVPNPGLIEGVAVAASPREGDLSPMEWARAMKDLGILPKLPQLFGLGFLGAHSGVAYTVSGAFVEHVRATHGAAAIRDWYGGKALPAITGESWADMEAKFLAALDAQPLTEAALAQAKARFDRPGIFGRRCPHVVDACRRRAQALSDGGDKEGALEQLAEVKSLDPNDPMVPLLGARVWLRAGETDTGKEGLRAVANSEQAPQYARDRALEDLADLELAPGGDTAFAVATYRDLMTRMTDEDRLRTLDVKILAAGSTQARAAIFYYLVGDPGRGPDRVRASELFGRWYRESPDDGLPDYLMARQLQGEGLYAESAARLDAALSKKLPLPRVEVETLRLRIVAACALGDPATARRTYDAFAGRPGVARARREAMESLVDRCAGDAGLSPPTR